MRGGSIIDATIIAAPLSTTNATGQRDPQMHQTKKGNQWYFGMKSHIGVDAGTGYVHTVTATAANVHDLDEAANLVRVDDEVVYTDAGYQGASKRHRSVVAELAGEKGSSWRRSAGAQSLDSKVCSRCAHQTDELRRVKNPRVDAELAQLGRFEEGAVTGDAVHRRQRVLAGQVLARPVDRPVLLT